LYTYSYVLYLILTLLDKIINMKGRLNAVC